MSDDKVIPYHQRLSEEILNDRMFAQRISTWVVKHFPEFQERLKAIHTESPDQFPVYMTGHSVTDPKSMGIYILDSFDKGMVKPKKTSEEELKGFMTYMREVEPRYNSAIEDFKVEFADLEPVFSTRNDQHDRLHLFIGFEKNEKVIIDLMWSNYFARG